MFNFSYTSIIEHKKGKIECCILDKVRIFVAKFKHNYATRRDYTSNAYLK